MLWLYVKLKTYLSGYRIITLVAWIVQISMLWFNVKLWTLFSGYMKATLIASILPDLGRWCWAACQSTRFAVTPVGPDLAGLLDCWGAMEPRWYRYILSETNIHKHLAIGQTVYLSSYIRAFLRSSNLYFKRFLNLLIEISLSWNFADQIKYFTHKIIKFWTELLHLSWIPNNMLFRTRKCN